MFIQYLYLLGKTRRKDEPQPEHTGDISFESLENARSFNVKDKITSTPINDDSQSTDKTLNNDDISK